MARKHAQNRTAAPAGGCLLPSLPVRHWPRPPGVARGNVQLSSSIRMALNGEHLAVCQFCCAIAVLLENCILYAIFSAGSYCLTLINGGSVRSFNCEQIVLSCAEK
jgi:hypothetical protein